MGPAGHPQFRDQDARGKILEVIWQGIEGEPLVGVDGDPGGREEEESGPATPLPDPAQQVSQQRHRKIELRLHLQGPSYGVDVAGAAEKEVVQVGGGGRRVGKKFGHGLFQVVGNDYPKQQDIEDERGFHARQAAPEICLQRDGFSPAQSPFKDRPKQDETADPEKQRHALSTLAAQAVPHVRLTGHTGMEPVHPQIDVIQDDRGDGDEP